MRLKRAVSSSGGSQEREREREVRLLIIAMLRMAIRFNDNQ